MGGGRKASEGSVISEMRCVAAQPRQMEYSYLCDQPTGFTMALQPLVAAERCCSLSVAYPDVEGSNECCTVYFPRLIDFKRTFRNGWRESQPLCSKVLRSRSVDHNGRDSS